MANQSTFPQLLPPYHGTASVVKFAAVQDSETGDNNLEPPFVRQRAPNRSWLYIDADRSTQVNSAINSANWVVGGSSPTGKSHLFIRKVKRMNLTYQDIVWVTPNCNPTNNVVTFRLAELPLVDITATIPIFNYERLFVDPRTLTGPPTADGEPDDGILSKLLIALNNAMDAARAANALPVDPTIHFVIVPSNGYVDVALNSLTQNTSALYWRIGRSGLGGPFIFTGGSLFERGKNLLGVNPITPVDFSNVGNYYPLYVAGPARLIYTRWIDIVSSGLTRWTKAHNAGTDVPSDLVSRLYMGALTNKKLGEFTVYSTQDQTWFNWNREDAISSVDIRILDEFGQPIELPQNSGLATSLSLVFSTEI